jgi:hypothetical protein
MGPFVSYEELVVLRKRSQVPSYNNKAKKFLTLSGPKLQVLFSANKGYNTREVSQKGKAQYG